jgi:nicotinamidase/pyrazinamidase
MAAGFAFDGYFEYDCRVSPASSPAALLVVDVQRDFCPGGALAVPAGDGVVPVLNRCLADAAERGVSIYASRDWHPSVTSHFKAYGGEWPAHCVQHTDGARFHPELRLPPSTIVITKGDDPDAAGYSAFDGRTPQGGALANDLRARGIATIYVGGLATEYCVRASVLAARREGFEVAVLRDAIAAIDLRPGDADRALAEMRAAGAGLTTSTEWLGTPTVSWRRRPPLP